VIPSSNPRSAASARNCVRWILALTVTQATAACGDDRTNGAFELHASHGLQTDVRGPTYAMTQWEVGGYWIVMDLTQNPSLLRAQERLSFEFAQRPDTGTWSGTGEPGRHGHDFTIGFGVDACNATSRWDADSTVASYWQVDSGRAHITSPLNRPGVSGSFVVHTHLTKCRAAGATTRIPGDTGGRMVLEGTFGTQPPQRHLIRTLIDFLGL
jgi:hypothetical protein